jgi:hypothetical protein
MSSAMVESENPSEVAEQALRALWMFDVTAFESCRCACCGGLRHSANLLAARAGISADPATAQSHEP